MEFSEKVRKEIEKYDSINMVFPYPVGSKVYVVNNYRGRDINFNVISTSSYDIPTTYFSQQYEAAKLSNADFVWLSQESRSMELVVQEAFENTLHFRYGQQCLKTWNMDHNHPQQISHAVHGLVGELIEFGDEHLRPDKDDEKIIDELGDVLYYRAILKFLMGDVATYEPSNKRSVLTAINKFSDIAKKIAYHKTWDSDKVRTRYAEGIQYLDNYLTTVMTMRDLSLQQVQQHNINKLQGVNGRHTNGFNPNY